MRIETLCTGDELLTGLTSDTNSRFFQTLLLERCGLLVRRSTVVGDDRAELAEVINALEARCDVVLVSGGLGPTADDVTIESAAMAAGVQLVEDPAVVEHIEARFRQRGLVVSENNRRQARVPFGSEVVLNQEGSAPLIIQRRSRCTFFFVPGVPREYRHLVGTHVVPRIAATLPAQRRTVSVLALLKTIGVPESHLDALISPLAPKHPDVTFGYRTEAPENHLKLLARGETMEHARRALQAAEGDARTLLGDAVFGSGDETLPQVVGERLASKNETLATAESCTGGLVAAACTSLPGASTWFMGGVSAYTERAKMRWAGVPESVLAAHGAVSEQAALAMARGVSDALQTSCGLSVTGYAGPGGGDAANPVGTVFIGVKTNARVHVERHRFLGDRERIRTLAAGTALDALRRILLSER